MKDERSYLSSLRTMVLADQSTTQNLKKYMNSGATSDLAKAQENIERAKQAALVFAGNRALLLRKIGLGEEEINAKLEEGIKQIEEIDQKLQN